MPTGDTTIIIVKIGTVSRNLITNKVGRPIILNRAVVAVLLARNIDPEGYDL